MTFSRIKIKTDAARVQVQCKCDNTGGYAVIQLVKCLSEYLMIETPDLILETNRKKELLRVVAYENTYALLNKSGVIFDYDLYYGEVKSIGLMGRYSDMDAWLAQYPPFPSMVCSIYVGVAYIFKYESDNIRTYDNDAYYG